jgi:Periplasmic component of the Tol biopolymer transport system
MKFRPIVKNLFSIGLFLITFLFSLPLVCHAQEKTAFASNRDGNYEIYVMNPDGSGQTRLTNNSANDSQPSFSRDGSKIAFASDREGNVKIFVMNRRIESHQAYK